MVGGLMGEGGGCFDEFEVFGGKGGIRL